MKKVVAILVAVAMGSCTAQQQIQVNMLGAELVKIDTVYRFSGSEQMLVWKTANNVEYVSYAPVSQPYQVGTRLTVMVRR